MKEVDEGGEGRKVLPGADDACRDLQLFIALVYGLAPTKTDETHLIVNANPTYNRTLDVYWERCREEVPFIARKMLRIVLAPSYKSNS